MRLAAIAGAVLSFVLCVVMTAIAGPQDPFIWLEAVDGAKALQWVRAENDYTLKILKAEPQYADILETATDIVTARDRIPYGNLAAGQIYNFWQDETHQRGVWRRTALRDYQTAYPVWETLLDLDALSARQNENWVWRGAICLPPLFTRCLVKLSRGGGDAIVVREFDVSTRSFVIDGFEVPEAKTDVAWVDLNTIMVATNWGAETLTKSGYARVVKYVERGQALRDATTLYEGQYDDVASTPTVEFQPDGKNERFIVRGLDFFSSELYHVDADWRVVRVGVPTFAEFKGLHKRQMLFLLMKDWHTAGRTFLQGSLVAFSLDDFLSSGGAMPPVRSLFIPDAKTAVQSVAISRDAVYLTYLENVKGRLQELTYERGNWSSRRVTLPDNGTVDVASSGNFDREVMVKFASFLVPDTLHVVAPGGEPKMIKQLPERFDADDDVVEQFEAVSADGTKIPYFLVRKKGAPLNGTTPTLLYAYGGFQISTTPWYWSTAGKLWLEEGGAYAIANVRGGGEFGPRWHDAARGVFHQRNFDDLAAVARDLIARQVTSSPKLGLIGGSQGGLLATATFVQNPDLFGAVSAQVPLTDMLRYTQMSAGASWVAEYGDPAVPEMRAVIERWSPYQNLRSGIKYPRVFFLTSTKDDRVHPGHARKMAAKMQANGQAILYYETLNGGHEADNTLKQRAEQLALVYAYFRMQLMD